MYTMVIHIYYLPFLILIKLTVLGSNASALRYTDDRSFESVDPSDPLQQNTNEPVDKCITWGLCEDAEGGARQSFAVAVESI